MAALTIYPASIDGLAETFVGATATVGDTLADDGKQECVFEFVNGSGAPINVTITAITTSVSVSKVGPITVANKVIAVPAGARRIIGPFPDAYRDAGGLVKATCSSVTSVTVRALRISPIDG